MHPDAALREAPVVQHDRPARAAWEDKMQHNEHTALVVRYARIVGIAYLVIIIASLLSFGFIDGAISVDGDLDATLANIAANEGLYRLGLVHDLLMFSAVILLA